MNKFLRGWNCACLWLFPFLIIVACSPKDYDYAFISDREGQLDLYVKSNSDTLVNATQDKWVDYGLKWSPDGKRIVFAKQVAGHYHLFLYDVALRSIQQLTRDTLDQYGPTFSPKGDKILFVSNRDHPLAEVYSMNLQTKRIVRITNNDRLDGSPTFHPDGIRIFYTSFMDRDSANRITNSEIFVTDTTGTTHTRLTNRPGNDGALDISPNGKLIALHYFWKGKADIYTMNLTGGEITQLTLDTLDNRWPRWTPDGKYLAYTRVAMHSDIWIMKGNGRGKKPFVVAPRRDEILEFNPKR